MSYDTSKLVKLGHLKELATKIKTDYATKAELQAIQIPEYSVTKQAAAEAGYLSTYYLTKDGAQVGEKINIPKDFLVNSADILEVETADDPYEGAQVGDLYIDFVVNSKNADDTATHIYLPVNELVDAYTGGNGIEVSAQNLISAKIDTANANGLAVTAAGFKLDLATASTAGAMSAADKAKLDGIAAGANNYTHPEHTAKKSGLYKVTVDAQGHVSGAEAVTKGDITGLGIPAQDTTYQKVTQQADGLMSKEDKAKLDGMVVAEDGEVTEMLNEVFTPVQA
ncbi:hypothetical protein [Flintibacter porci]|uniref:hypothetical protein n=1 Tax=Flintibacter porci TaxID=3342383 RepID=UPI003F8CC09C